MIDVTPQFLDDAVDGIEGLAEDGYHLAGDALGGIVSLHEKTVNGLWDIAEDGYEVVVGAASQALDYLWSLVPEPIRHPFGDSAPLRDAAAGWREVLGGLDAATTSLAAGGRSLAATWDGGRSDRFLDLLGDLGSVADQLADDVESLAAALEDAAGAIDDLNHLVHAVAAELAATLVISVVLGLVTCGTAGVATMAVRVTAMVARVTGAVRSARAVMWRVRLAVAAVRSSRIGRWLERDGNAVRVASTVGGNGVGTGVATGRNPLDWSVPDWLGVGISSTVSIGTVPVVRAHGLNPDHLGVTVGSGAAGNAASTTVTSNLQGLVPGIDDLGVSVLAGGLGAGAGAASVRHLTGGRATATSGEDAVGRVVEGDVQGIVGRVMAPPAGRNDDGEDGEHDRRRSP